MAVTTDEAHEQHVLAQHVNVGARDLSQRQPPVVAHLLFRPHADHLPRVGLAIAVAEAELAGDVAIAIAEDENRRFVDLDGEFGAGRPKCVVHVGLLASRDAAVDALERAGVDKLEEQQARAWVEDLVDCGAFVAREPSMLRLRALALQLRERAAS